MKGSASGAIVASRVSQAKNLRYSARSALLGLVCSRWRPSAVLSPLLQLALPLPSSPQQPAGPYAPVPASHMSSVAAGVPTNLSQHQQRGRRQAAAVAAGSGVVQSSTRMRAARTGLLGRATAFTSSMLAPAAAARDASSNASSKVAHAAAARAARGDGASPGDGDAKASSRVEHGRHARVPACMPADRCCICCTCTSEHTLPPPLARCCCRGAHPPPVARPPLHAGAGARAGEHAEGDQLALRQEQHHEDGGDDV